MKRNLSIFIIFVLIFLSGCSNKRYNLGIKDTGKPIILGLNNFKTTYDVGTSKPNWLEGIQAIDFVDGDLTNKIQIDDSNVDVDKLGVYTVLYSVRDQSGNEITKEIQIEIKDMTSPIISGVSDIVIELNSTKPDLLINTLVTDNYDGVITDKLLVDDSLVDYTKPGSYKVKYNVEDNSGNKTQLKTTLTILEEDERVTEYKINVGDTVNLVKSTETKFKTGANIFDETWFSSLDIISIDTNKSEGNFLKKKSQADFPPDTAIEDFTNTMNSYESFNPFIPTTFYRFKDEMKAELDLYKTKYFYVYETVYRSIYKGLPEYRSNPRQYIENLNTNYLNSLYQLKNNQMSYEDFFNLHGTHLIAKGNYGGTQQIFCSILSNKESEELPELCEEISAGIPALGGNSTSITRNDDITYFAIQQTGGSSFMITPDEDFSESNTKWLNSINKDIISLISFGEDGLVPLWELLPDEYSDLKETMQQKYIEYEQKYRTE